MKTSRIGSGESRSTVTNTLRLLELAPEVQAAVEGGQITEGHARAIGGVTDQELQKSLLDRSSVAGLSVRQTEELVRRARSDALPVSRKSAAPTPDVERLERGLREALATKVTLSSARKGGRITIEYYDEDDLERLYERLTGGPTVTDSVASREKKTPRRQRARAELRRAAAANPTPLRASRSSKASRPSASARACTSARPTRAVCTS